MRKMLNGTILNYFYMPGEVCCCGIEIRGCGYMEKIGGKRFKRNFQEPCHAISYWTAGAGIFESANAGKHSIEPGTIALRFPGEKYAYGPTDARGLVEYWVLLDGPLPPFLFQTEVFNKSTCFFEIGVLKPLVSHFAKMVEIARDGMGVTDAHVLAGTVFNICCEIAHACSGRTGEGSAGKIMRTIAMQIGQRPHEAWNFHSIASQNHMSYALFRLRFAEVIGVPPGRYLMRARISRALTLLSGGASVKNACFGAGFNDPSYFSNAIKKFTGKSPKEFRN
ncbi:MAG: helix-turn-helix domain-containing protein [Chitinivibrionales bacterium]|nr:helix-turn-helix domain-containing protein [Chitinivibrionales bacterium]